MEVIHEFERRPRGLYTGSIGHLRPGGDFSFNVAIRALELQENGIGVLGIGSGIVANGNEDPSEMESQPHPLRAPPTAWQPGGCALSPTTVNPDPANGATDDAYDREGYSSRGDYSTCEGSSNIRDSNRIRNTKVRGQR